MTDNKEQEIEKEVEEIVAEQDQEQTTEETSENATADEPAEPSAEEKIQELNDKYLRLYSEFENFRKRTAKEKIDLIQSGGSEVIKNMLPVCDDFERAIASNETAVDIDSIKEGFQLLQTKLTGILSQSGLKPMDSLGKVFDVDEHEALTKIPAPEEDLKGKIVDVVEKGYFLNDKVLRFAKVVVGE